MENGSSNKAISIHLYSPPYMECRDKDAVIPIVYCSLLDDQIQRGEVSKELELQLQHQRVVYSNFRTLHARLCKAFSQQNKQHVLKLLESIQLHPREWSRYTQWNSENFTQNLVSNNVWFISMIYCWNPGQK